MPVPAHIMIQPGSWSTSGPQVRCSIDASHDAALASHLMRGFFHRGRTLGTPPEGDYDDHFSGCSRTTHRSVRLGHSI